MKISVYPSLNLYEPLTYEYGGDPSWIGPGARVLVPLGSRIVSGWVMEDAPAYVGAVKPVAGVIVDDFRPDELYLRFVRAVAERFHASTGILLDHALPPSLKALARLKAESGGRRLSVRDLAGAPASEPLRFSFPPSRDPHGAAARESHAPEAAPLGGFSESLLLSHELTPAYREVLSRWKEDGLSALLVVPDARTARHWQESGLGLSPYHSDLTPKEKNLAWQNSRSGVPAAFVGSLSALFLPLPRLGGIIVDRIGASPYHAFSHSGLELPEVAAIRARIQGVPLLLGGASHTMRTYRDRGCLTLSDQRPQPLPAAEVVPLKKGSRDIPPELLEEVRSSHAAQQSTWVLVSRRFSDWYPYCPACKKNLACPRCQAPLRGGEGPAVACPSCSFTLGAKPLCPDCGSALEEQREMDINTLAAAIRRRMGESDLLVLAEEEEFREPIPAILISTPRWIGPAFASRFDTIIFYRPESLFRMNRFRSAERIFTATAELRGLLRPGGRLLLYSSFHFHYAFRLLNREDEFWEREDKYRQWFHLPPYSPVFRLEVRHATLRGLAGRLREIKSLEGEALLVPRLALASRQKVRGFYRGEAEVHGWPRDLAANGLFAQKGVTFTAISD